MLISRAATPARRLASRSLRTRPSRQAVGHKPTFASDTRADVWSQLSANPQLRKVFGLVIDPLVLVAPFAFGFTR